VSLAHRLRACNVLHYRLRLDEARTQTTLAERALLRETAARARTIVEIGARACPRASCATRCPATRNSTRSRTTVSVSSTRSS
jgi:hypothetical protein